MYARLKAIADVYDEWVEETGVKIYAVSLDEAQNEQRVKPFVENKGWEYEVLLDPNGDFKRQLGVSDPLMCLLLTAREISSGTIRVMSAAERKRFLRLSRKQ